MPGSTPATSQLDWLISTTAMIVLSWSKATRDLLKSFGWGIRALHQLVAATMVPFLAACPIPSLWDTLRVVAEPGGAAAFAARFSGRYEPRPGEHIGIVLSGGNTTAVNFGS